MDCKKCTRYGLCNGCYLFLSKKVSLFIKDNVITKCCGDQKEIIIPDGINEIGAFSLRNRRKLIKVVIPDSVKKIGTWAFAECVNLESVNIPNSVVAIKAFAFNYCNISEIFIPDSVKKIERGAFANTKLNKISISDEVIVEDRNFKNKENFDLTIRYKNEFTFKTDKIKIDCEIAETKNIFLNAIIEFIKNDDGADEKIHSENAKYLSNRFDYYSDIATNQEKVIMLEYINKNLKVDRIKMIEDMFSLN